MREQVLKNMKIENLIATLRTSQVRELTTGSSKLNCRENKLEGKQWKQWVHRQIYFN